MARARRNNPILTVIPGGKDAAPPPSPHPKGEAPPYKAGDAIPGIGTVTGCRWVETYSMEPSPDGGLQYERVYKQFWQVVVDRDDAFLVRLNMHKGWCYNAEQLIGRNS